MILLDNDEIRNFVDTVPVQEFTFAEVACDVTGRWIGFVDNRKLQKLAKAQAKKILIELQSIYKLPDLKMEHERMGEFIKGLMEEIE